MVRRIIAERIRTGEILSWDVPLLGATCTRDLSGPGGINGAIRPRTRSLLGPDSKPLLREWATALYYEASGQIRGGGIVTRIFEDEDGSLRVEAPGFSTYPHGIPYTGLYQPGIGADALDVVREVWSHVQSFPEADLGVTVDPLVSGTKVSTTDVDGIERPYTLPWWETRDCGAEIDAMLEGAPADYIETHDWNEGHTGFEHRIRLGSPRLGKKRHDLRFVEGENVVQPIPYQIDGDDYASTVIGLGSGEGRTMARHEVATRDQDRLRRVAVVADKSKSTAAALDPVVRREHKARADTDSFAGLAIRDHANARISAIQPGDDIEVEADLTWYGRTRQWVRVLSIEESIDGDDIAVLSTAPSSRFAA